MRRLIGWFISAFLISASSFSQAFMVTIEPDDYAAGTDLSNVSPYVTLRSRYNIVGGVGDSPVTATAALPGHPAPTGNLTFGHHGFYAYAGDDGSPLYTGFALTFHQEISSLTLLANSLYPGLPVDWAAYDRAGNSLGMGRVFGDASDSFLIDLQLDNLWSIAFGGFSGIAAIAFDRLTFDVVDVPEPDTWMLLLPGLLMLALQRKTSAALPA